MRYPIVALYLLAALVFVCRATLARDESFPALGSLATAQSQTAILNGQVHDYLIQLVRDDRRHPVVVLLHGGDGDDRKVWVQTSLPTLGLRDGFIVVAPNASRNNHWNDGRGTVGEGAPSTADDVSYLKALISRVVERDHGDANAVFIVGISNGGVMAIHFACAAGYMLRAGGNVISNLTVKDARNCATHKPLPWISINGNADPRMPFTGSREGVLINGRPQAALESADQTFAFFADRARCSPSLRLEMLPDIDAHDGSTAEKRVRSDCVGGTTSTQYVLRNSGHNVPGLEIDAKRKQQYGPANEDFDAGIAIWNHFRQTL